MKRLLLLAPVLFFFAGKSQNLLKSGPMKGYCEMREAAIWVQMEEPCIVELVYWPDTMPAREFRSTAKTAEPNTAHTALLTADSVEPGTIYGYDIYANGRNQTGDRELTFTTQTLWQFRTDPPNLTIALGSCAYINEEPYDRPGKPYGSGYSIFETIASVDPDMMLWLGDNIYLREVDWFSRSGIQRRYTHTRSRPELQDLLATAHHYAIWDDHDYGPNDAARTFPFKDETLDAFKLFWANNKYGVNDLGGITNAFEYGDAHFFLLDNRWYRSEKDMKTVEEQMLGQEQIDWLIELLKYSRAPFKFVACGSQVLNTVAKYENYANYEKEREMLLDRIAQEGITGVVFLTGDRHHTEMSMVEMNGIKIYDLTVSPLTSGTHRADDEPNENRIEGSLIHEHNFGTISISGPRKARKLDIEIRTAENKVLWNYTIEEEQ